MSRLFHARRNMQKRLLDLLEHVPPELVKELTGEDPGAAKATGDTGGGEDAAPKKARSR
jgi:hypothetical protein